MKLIALIVKILILLFFIILAVFNTHSVPFAWLPGSQVALPLIVLLLVFFVIGALFGVLAMFGRLLGLRHENNRLRAEVKKNARVAREEIAPPAVRPDSPAAKE